jgi:hypothetical protein
MARSATRVRVAVKKRVPWRRKAPESISTRGRPVADLQFAFVVSQGSVGSPSRASGTHPADRAG